ncbi:MAG TPA: hypothetical protein VGO54_05095 [Bradyrhizobium sp.]|jgi:hypothetical protein|nr:hypothetical protein [Bradyrhizobium sp.]
MAKKVAKAKKTTKAKTAARKSAMFSVAIQKVLEKMKAIVDGGKENEFLERCLTLKEEDRFVIVNARIVKLVKEFAAEHDLSHNLRTIAFLSPAAAAPLDGETCFKH